MALQVWLPLNGDLNNKGLSGIAVTNGGATVDNNGKLGKCYSFGTSTSYLSIPPEAMTSFTTEASICFWINILSWNTTWATYFQAGTNGTAWSCYRFGFLRNSSGSNCAFVLGNGSSTTTTSYTTPTLELNKWYHVALIYKTGYCAIYINGNLHNEYAPTIVPAFAGITHITIGMANNKSSYQTNCLLNDFRIYDHCLSSKEVNEISKALLVHYKLDGDTSVENLFTGTAMTPDVRAGFVNNGSTDWTKPLRYYNGSTAIHTFSDTVPAEDTIKLSTAGNLGIAFVRSAADMNLDSSAYYTISCKAKCSASGKKLCIGLSYYTTSNSWVWRGGQNAKAFSAVNTWQTFTLKFKPDANTQYICYCFTVAGTANGTATFTIKECKLEKGSSATAWTPSKLDSVAPLFYKKPGYDCSGYCRNGEIIDNAGVVTGGRFNNSIKNSASTLLKSQVNIPALETITFSWWQKVETWGYQSSGLFATSNNSSYPGDYSTTACAHRDVGFDLCTEAGTHVRLGYSWLSSNGSTLVGSWHHMAITYNNAVATLFVDGTSVATTDLSGALKHFDYLYIGNSLNRYTIGAYSDFRIYGTALTAEQVLELYNTAAFVDNKQNVETFEFDEVTSGNPNITKSGIFKAQTFTEDVAAEIYEAEVKANQLIEI